MDRERRIKSFDVFSQELVQQRPESVSVLPYCRPSRSLFRVVQTGAVGRAGEFNYGLSYGVHGTKNRLRVYDEPLFTADQSEYGFHDRDERNHRLIAAHLAGEIRVGQLSLILAEVDISLVDQKINPLSQAALDMMHEQARLLHIEPPEFVV